MYQRGINLCGIEDDMKTTTSSTGDVIKPVVWKNSTVPPNGLYASSNCGYLNTFSSSMTTSSSTLDDCASQCVGTSDCNYFTYSGTTCIFLYFDPSVQPLAYVDPTQSCGSVISRPSFAWTTDGDMQTSTNCDFNGGWSGTSLGESTSLEDCISNCLTTYSDSCNFFTLDSDGTCSLLQAETNGDGSEPPVKYSSTNTNCGYVPSRV